MSGIFDVYGRTGNSAKQQFSSAGPVDSGKKSFPMAMSLGNVAGASEKNISSRPKPKGLSIRSKSDLNVTGFAVNRERSPAKKSPVKGHNLKTAIGPFGDVARQLSPRSREKNSKLQTVKSKQLKALSSKSRSPGNNALPPEKMQAEAISFKQPFAPKNTKNRPEACPEPEKLASYYDDEENLYTMAENLDQEFVRLMRLSRLPVKPYEDEGFESDPEVIEMSRCEISDDSFEGEIALEPPSPPTIPVDDDDDFFILD